MTTDGNSKPVMLRLTVVLLVVALTIAVVWVLGSVLPETGAVPRERAATKGPEARVPTPTGPAAEEGHSPDQWLAVRQTGLLLIKAEDVKKLEGKMKLATDLDNEKVLDNNGERARVSFVWVEDKACEKGTESEHKAFFELNVPKAGTYYPWARVWWTDGCGDSIVVSIRREGQEPVECVVTDGTHKRWHWLPLVGSGGLNLTEGAYMVIVENREDGARLSRILFATKDYETYMPETPEG